MQCLCLKGSVAAFCKKYPEKRQFGSLPASTVPLERVVWMLDCTMGYKVIGVLTNGQSPHGWTKWTTLFYVNTPGNAGPVSEVAFPPTVQDLGGHRRRCFYSDGARSNIFTLR
jgi:hypothetical protein